MKTNSHAPDWEDDVQRRTSIPGSTLAEEIDHFYVDPSSDLNRIWEWTWECFISPLPFRNEFPFFLRREYLDHTSKISHRHNDFMALYVVRRGRGTRVVNGHPHSMARGDVFLMAPGSTHYFDAPIQLYLDAIYFRETLWSEREWQILLSHPVLESYCCSGLQAFEDRGNTDYLGHLSPEPYATIENALSEMRNDYHLANEVQHVCVRNRLFNLLVQLAFWREAGLFSTRAGRRGGISKVLDFCDANFHKNIAVEQLAAMTHLSVPHFREVFTAEVGIPPTSYLRRLRLQHAQTLLRDRELAVADVARLSGFGGPTQLTRAFKKTFGMSPLDFRLKRKAAS